VLFFLHRISTYVAGPDYIALAIPLFFAFIGLEIVVARKQRRMVYHFADAITNLACGVSQQVTNLFMASGLLAVYVYVYEHGRLVTFNDGSVAPWLIAAFGVDFCYYWWHRLSHRVNFLWAVHVVHHSSEDFNLAVALRQEVLGDLTATPFYLVLALAGVTPLAVFTCRSLSLVYQFWIHTEIVGKLGPLDRWVNTPSAHRVHHAVNERYIDRNFAAVLMIWDRLFGSYEPEREVCVYGITKPLRSFNPLWAQVHHWMAMANVAAAAPSFWQGFQVFVRPPGWRPPWLLTTPLDAAPVSPQAVVKYEVAPRQGLNAYIGVQFALVAVATFILLMFGTRLSPWTRGALAVWTIASLWAWGALVEAKSWGLALEATRLLFGCLAGTVWMWSGGLPTRYMVPAFGVATSSMFWLFRMRALWSRPTSEISGCPEEAYQT
jgi:alkylglycerol monooxygenase